MPNAKLAMSSNMRATTAYSSGSTRKNPSRNCEVLENSTNQPRKYNIWKHPIEDFNTGAQLIVHESQEAVFFINGEALDLFGPGRHTLETQNMPLVGKFFNRLTLGLKSDGTVAAVGVNGDGQCDVWAGGAISCLFPQVTITRWA
jgi:hypothetical protein